MTILEVDELLSLVCDELCRYPREITDRDELDDECESCPLLERLMKEVEK